MMVCWIKSKPKQKSVLHFQISKSRNLTIDAAKNFFNKERKKPLQRNKREPDFIKIIKQRERQAAQIKKQKNLET